MGYLAIPMIIAILALPAPGPGAEELSDFGRLQRVVNEEVYVTDTTGVERRLRLVDAGSDAVRLLVAQQTIALARDEVVRIERVHDGSTDGAVKGAIIGGLAGLAFAQAVEGGARHVLRGALMYGSVGFLFDRANVARQTVYRAPATRP